MRSVKKMLSLVLSGAIALSSAATVLPMSSSAAKTDSDTIVYDNTSDTESKEASLTEVPFNVFDIYNAYKGIPKTTTTTSATTSTTTTTTTTAITTTTTTAATTTTTTTTTVPTTKLTFIPTTTSMVMPPKYTVTARETTATSTAATTSIKDTSVSSAQGLMMLKPQNSNTVVTTQTDSVTTTSTTTDSCPGAMGDFYLNGIDVSEHQGYIDWNMVDESGIDYAIIRAGYGKESYQRDLCFDRNMQDIQNTDIYYGIYWFSYAMSVEEAQQEAEACCEIIKDYDGYTFPIYFDIETNAQRDYLTTAEASAITETFCSYLQEQGYYVGIYSCSSFLQTKLYSNVTDKYDVWVAQYADKVSWYTGNYGMWQYTSTGYVNGINTDVDMNYCYVNYPKLISPETYTGLATTYIRTTSVTTTTTTAVSRSVPEAPASIPITTTAAPVTTVATNPPETTTTTAPAIDPYNYTAIGISVSADNGYIDWNSVRNAGYSFGVISAGGGDSTDPLFYVNMENAKSAGIYCGVSWQAQSTTEEGMIKEAESFYKLIRNYCYEYPIYLDLNAIADAGLSKEEYSNLITAFCSYFEGMRYYIGVRADESFLTNCLDKSVFEAYDVYLVNNGDKPVFESKYGAWQFGKETVSGVLGMTDVAYCYRVYPSVMSYYGLNGCY